MRRLSGILFILLLLFVAALPVLPDVTRPGLTKIPIVKSGGVARTPDNSATLRACLDSISAPYDTTGLCFDLQYDSDRELWYPPDWVRWPDSDLLRSGGFRIYAVNPVGADTLLDGYEGVVFEDTYPIFAATDSAGVLPQTLSAAHHDSTERFRFPVFSGRHFYFNPAGAGSIGIHLDGAKASGDAIQIDGSTDDQGRAVYIKAWANNVPPIEVELTADNTDTTAGFYIDVGAVGNTSVSGVEVDFDDVNAPGIGVWIHKNAGTDQDTIILLKIETDGSWIETGGLLIGEQIYMEADPQDTSTVIALDLYVEDEAPDNRALRVLDGTVEFADTLILPQEIDFTGITEADGVMIVHDGTKWIGVTSIGGVGTRLRMGAGNFPEWDQFNLGDGDAGDVNITGVVAGNTLVWTTAGGGRFEDGQVGAAGIDESDDYDWTSASDHSFAAKMTLWGAARFLWVSGTSDTFTWTGVEPGDVINCTWNDPTATVTLYRFIAMTDAFEAWADGLGGTAGDTLGCMCFKPE